MNLLTFLPLVVVFAILRWRGASMLGWLAFWWFAPLVFLRFGFDTPIPLSVIKIYMGIITLALVAYVMSDRQRQSQVREPIAAFLTEKRYQPALLAVMLALPALVMLRIYMQMTAPPTPPNFARTVHPAPPNETTVHDGEFDLGVLDNPLRALEDSDPEAFAVHVEIGREIYYRNCFYCHGDLMRGEGLFAAGLNPIPTDFQDPGTIAMLRESFLFWRIAKGGPGMPEEGGPWDSAMPAWETFLDPEEIWQVILFLYEFTGHDPRAREELH